LTRSKSDAIAAYAARLAATAPPPTPQQLERLAALLRPAARAVAERRAAA
jgi:hypothetical protein